ncbi:MAG: hypothetical protein ABFS17_06975 [Chloroflexota bacterium]
MSHLKQIIRIVGIFTVAAVGIWALSSSVTPGVETVAHQEAVRAAAYGQTESASPSEGFAGVVTEVTPISVNIADVVNVPIDSMYDRWLRGELDLDEMEYRVSRAEREALQEESRNMSPQDVLVPWDSNQPEQSAPTIQNSFDALDVSDCCGGSTSVPPDSDMAAGPNHLIAVENSSFEIYNKAGTSLWGPILFDSFHGGSGTFDPTVMYDSEEDRFVMNIEDGEQNFLMVSRTSDPTGPWSIYKWDVRVYGDEFFDYPHIGIGDHAIFMGANMFGGSIPGGFEGRIWAMDKNAAYSHNLMSVRTFSTGAGGGTPQPLNLTGFSQGTVPQPFNTHFFITDQYDGTTADLWAWPHALSSGTPSIVNTYDLNALSGWTAGFPVSASQSGTGADQIEANDWRFRGFEYRNGQGWTTDTVSYNYGAGTVDIERVFTMNLNGAPYSAIAVKGGGYTDSNVLFPDLAVDHCGNLAAGHERSDSSIYPSIEVGGMRISESSLQMPTQVKAGEVTYYSFDGDPLRWGDYSGMTVDPDGKTFWYMGEYAKDISGYSANYGNYIAKMTFNCIVPKRPSGKITDRTPKFAWTRALAADLYQIQLFQNGVFVSNEYATDGYCGPTYCGKTPGVTLDYSNFTWKVRARVGGVWKDWSPLEAFMVTSVPVPKSPSGAVYDTTPRYSWLKKPGAGLYHFQLYQGGALVYNQYATDGYCGAEYCGKTPTTTLGAFDYVWKIRARTGGVWGAWSSFESFSVYP